MLCLQFFVPVKGEKKNVKFNTVLINFNDLFIQCEVHVFDHKPFLYLSN